MLTPALDRRSADVAGAQPDRHERRDHHAGVDLDQAVDDELAVDDVDAGCTTTGSPIEIWAIIIASRWAIRGSTGIPRACSAP